MIRNTLAASFLAASFALTIDSMDTMELAQTEIELTAGFDPQKPQPNLDRVHEQYDALRARGRGYLGDMMAYVWSDNHVDPEGVPHPGEGWIVVKDARVNDYHPSGWKCFTINEGGLNKGKTLQDFMLRVEDKYPNQTWIPVNEWDAFSLNSGTPYWKFARVNYKMCGGWEEVLERLVKKEGVDTYIFTKYIEKSPPRNYRDVRHHE